MARFHPLTVTGVRHTIRDAVELTLAPPPEAAREFAFTPGQYLTFRKELEGVELRRCYSICAGLDDGVIRVGIKKVADGAFSSWANTELKPGDVLEAMPPAGRFGFMPEPGAGRHYLAFAGGSGITPILSIIRSVLAREPASQVTLVYANKAVNTIMFREELEDLKNRYLDRFSVVHVLETDAQEIELFTGMLTAEKLKGLFRYWIEPRDADRVLICGPAPMMEVVESALLAHGVEKEKIRIERFRSDQPGRLPLRQRKNGEMAGKTCTARITLDGATRTVTVPMDGTPVLQAALDAQMDAPHSCRAGICSTCMARLTAGEVEMIANNALEDYEVERGYILTCQSLPLSEEIELTYDHGGE